MVEAVHTLRTHALLYHVAVPTLPDSSGPIVNRIEPTWVLTLEEQFVSDILHTILCEGWHQDRSAQETSLQTVVMLCKILT